MLWFMIKTAKLNAINNERPMQRSVLVALLRNRNTVLVAATIERKTVYATPNLNLIRRSYSAEASCTRSKEHKGNAPKSRRRGRTEVQHLLSRPWRGADAP